MLRTAHGRDGATPDWLSAGDHPWLRVLVDEHVRFVGRPRRELIARLREPLPCFAPRPRLVLACDVLARLFRGETKSAIAPRVARECAFLAGAEHADRNVALATAAARTGVTPAALEAALFADLPGERLVARPDEVPTLPELALRANLLLAQSLLHRAYWVRITIEGRSRAIVRQAKLRGLLCTVAEDQGVTRLSISGPLTLLRKTLLYGRALGQLVPILSWCNRFECEALCALGRAERLVRLRSGDPVFPSAEPKAHASRVEARFARDFAAIAPSWDVLVEPEPVAAGSTLIFPDFLLRHRTIPGRQWLLEIVGFWTPEYLHQKLALLREARIANLILCIDAERACSGDDVPRDAVVLRYRRFVDARAVLAAVELR